MGDSVIAARYGSDARRAGRAPPPRSAPQTMVRLMLTSCSRPAPKTRIVILNVPVVNVCFWIWMSTSPSCRSPHPVGLDVETTPFGGMSPLRPSVTLPLKPFRQLMVTKYGAPVPRLRVWESGLTVTVKSGTAVVTVGPAGAAAATGVAPPTGTSSSASPMNGSVRSVRILRTDDLLAVDWPETTMAGSEKRT